MKGVNFVIKFKDLYTQVIYNYLQRHDDEIVLLKNIQEQYHISQPTIRKRLKWLADNKYIKKNKRHIEIIPQFN